MAHKIRHCTVWYIQELLLCAKLTKLKQKRVRVLWESLFFHFCYFLHSNSYKLVVFCGWTPNFIMFLDQELNILYIFKNPVFVLYKLLGRA